MADLEMPVVEAEPKVDLHLHLDGALPPEAIMKVAGDHGVQVPDLDEQSVDALRKHYPDFGPFHASQPAEFDRFLGLFKRALSVMQTPETIHDATLEVVRDLKRQNVVYAELRFAPSYHCAQGHSMNEMVEAVLKAMKNGEQETGVVTRLIVVIPREIAYLEGYNGPDAREIVRTALEFQNQGVVAIDLACSEHFGPEAYIEVFQNTVDERILRTVHAGETGPKMEDNIMTALNDMFADGLGHARPLPGMPEAMMVVKDHLVRVERAPISNTCMAIGEDFDGLDVLLNEGVLVSVNSDDPGIFGEGCSLSANLLAVANRYGLGVEGLRKLTLNAARSAFIPLAERKALEERIKRQW